MSDQWGRWFADRPRDDEAPVEQVAEQSDAVEAVAQPEPVAEYEAPAEDESFAIDEPVIEDEAVAESEPDVEHEPVAVDEPAAELEPDDEDVSDPAVSSVYALRQRLGELEELQIAEHPARYEQLHAELTAALGQIDGGA